MNVPMNALLSKLIRFSLITFFLSLNISAFSQECFGFIDPTPLANSVSIYYDQGADYPTGSDLSIAYVVDKDNVSKQEICGRLEESSFCTPFKDQTNESAWLTSRYCAVTLNYYIDVIDVKFEYTHHPSCGSITIKNISDSVNFIGLNNFIDLSNWSYTTEELSTYIFEITDYKKNTTQLIECAIGKTIVLPESDYTIKLYLQASETYLADEQDLLFYNPNSKYNPNGCVVTGEKAATNNPISYSPNPVQNALYLKNLTKGETISIYNPIGILVGSYLANSSEMEINVSKLATGIYFIQNNQQQFRILKD